MPQFVILHHRLPAESGRGDHFDLMLEDGPGGLLTWAVAKIPSSREQPAEQLPPHRRDYLTYEGPISNNRGEVQRVAAGTFEWLRRDEAEVRVRLTSMELSGELALRRQAGAWLVQLTA
ncbi:DNA polymerase ligase N-terminal domain-containing protein [Anatilimnocola floriformis]|uniref:DNA polymerase ligase N-terminal domain-containing protein n=1 Tax=Anatilimnocola floriformis TaxID=2948575 RepID=UPI0020C2EAF5|nr:DNA polymerase ligase N-terminal domain-containing protein [Anatilimnocola floriformis]